MTIATPEIPVVSNVTAEPHGDPESIRGLLRDQITQPVQWFGSVDLMAAQGVDAYVECGPGRVLSGLIRRTQKEAQLANVQDVPSLEKTVESLGSEQKKEEQWEHSTEK
jgi:[acyl-carrier-protein] S-malonyltransferase